MRKDEKAIYKRENKDHEKTKKNFIEVAKSTKKTRDDKNKVERFQGASYNFYLRQNK